MGLVVYKLYHITSTLTRSYYIGITKLSLARRWASHKYDCRHNKKTKLYDCMRKYGIENFSIKLIDTFETREACIASEIKSIKFAKKENHKILNMTDGGDGGNTTQKYTKEELSRRMSNIRKLRKNFKHSEKTKDKLRKLLLGYSLKQNKKYKNPEEIIVFNYKEAKKLFGISTTHYYRLRKQYKENKK